MPKLTDLKFQFDAKAGDPFSFISKVNVSSEGLFSVSLPDEIEQLAQSIKTTEPRFDGLSIRRHRDVFRVFGKQLELCKELVSATGQQYVQCDVKTEKVILYMLDANVSYATNEHGRVFPNGYYAGDSYKWHGNLTHSDVVPAYNIGLGAIVMLKTTYTRGSIVEVEYNKIIGEQTECFSKMLNSFNHIRLDPKKSHEIPYSEEAAQFFFNIMLNLCKAANRLETFFADKQAVFKAIQDRKIFHIE